MAVRNCGGILQKLSDRLAAGAFICQAYYVVRFRPYSKWSGNLERPESIHDVPDWQVERAAYLCALIRRLSGPFAENISCIVKVIAGKKLLTKNGIKSEIVLGVPREGVVHVGGWQAHAWLLVGDKVLIGGRESRLYERIKR